MLVTYKIFEPQPCGRSINIYTCKLLTFIDTNV